MEAVIFDMDGVIVDSEPLNDQHHAIFFPQIGLDFAKNPPKSSFHGMNSKSMWTILKADYDLEESIEDLIARARASYMSFLEALPEIPIVPGVRDLIIQLAESGHVMAVASSANPRRVELFLNRLDLARYFKVIVHGDDVEHGKPHPEAFLIAASRLAVEPKDCVVIEDSSAGVQSAKAAGMKCIGFAGLPHNHEDLSEADAIVTDFDQATSFIKQGRLLSDLIES